MSSYRFGFILEQALGHITHARNLQTNIARDYDVAAYWGLIPWETKGLSRHVPLYASNWTVRAGLRARQAIGQMTSQAKLDALFFHTQVPAMFALDWLRHIPSVISLDATPIQYDTLGQSYSHNRGPVWAERLKWQLHRSCFDAAALLVTWSSWAKHGLVEDYFIPEERVIVIPPGVNTAEWARPTPRARHADPVKILFVGADFARKGGPLLLDAFRELRHLGVELHLVTRAALAPEPGVFYYTDMRPNSSALKQLYHNCDIFCLPTYGDCLPMVLSEAGAAGLPVVTTRVAGIPEIVCDGENGALVPVGQVEALAQALRRLVLDTDSRLRQGERAAVFAARRFDARRNSQQLLDVLKIAADMRYRLKAA